MPQNPKNKISQTEIKHCKKSSRTEVLKWLKITTCIGKKIKVETEVKYRYQKLLDFINIDIIKFEGRPSP